MIDPNSSTWQAVVEEVTKELHQTRATLETRHLPAVETEYLRGKIGALKWLLDLATPRPIVS